MPRVLEWDKAGERRFRTGVSKVVLYPDPLYENGKFVGYTNGVAWNGVTAINESPDGGEANNFFADNIKYASIRSAENAKGSISAYHYPDALKGLDGNVEAEPGLSIGQQLRTKRFGLCYRTELGTDTNPNAGYELHMVYGAMISPSEKNHETMNENPDLQEFSWDYECLPIKSKIRVLDGTEPKNLDVSNFRPTIQNRGYINAVASSEWYDMTEMPNSGFERKDGWVTLPRICVDFDDNVAFYSPLMRSYAGRPYDEEGYDNEIPSVSGIDIEIKIQPPSIENWPETTNEEKAVVAFYSSDFYDGEPYSFIELLDIAYTDRIDAEINAVYRTIHVTFDDLYKLKCRWYDQIRVSTKISNDILASGYYTFEYNEIIYHINKYSMKESTFSEVVINSNYVPEYMDYPQSDKMLDLEKVLYGDVNSSPVKIASLPLPNKIIYITHYDLT